MKPMQTLEFSVDIPSGIERQHIQERGNDILGGRKPKIERRGKIQVLKGGGVCAPSKWEKRFKKTV
jgi:hypothetical protein